MAGDESKLIQIRDRVKSGIEDSLDSMYTQLLAQPKTTLLIMIIISSWFANIGSTFQDQIEDDLEIFLPENADSTDLLMEVRGEWSTDIGIIYIQTENAKDPENYGNTSKITQS